MKNVPALIARLSAGILAFGILTGVVLGDTVVQLNLNGQVPGIFGPVNYFQLQLFDSQAPITVNNFLQYVNNDVYDGTIIHRSIEDFVIQGGGFNLEVNAQNVVTGINPVANYGPILNEFSSSRSNIRGTIAMAKNPGSVNSATNQWFINVADNSGSPPFGLDYQNGGFTVFGRVAGEGMTIVDIINSMPTYDINTLYDPDGSMGQPFEEVPLADNGATFIKTTSVSVIPTVAWIGGVAPAATDWGQASNWAGGAVPGGAGVNLSLGSQASANDIIELGDSDRTVGNIYLTNNTRTTIQSTGGKKLILNNNGNTSLINAIGNHVISAPLQLNNNTLISVLNPGSSTQGNLYISGIISGSGSFAKLDDGWLVLSNTNTYTGSTLITAGVLGTLKAASLPGYNAPGKVKVYSDAWLAVNAGAPGTTWSADEINALQSNAIFDSGAVLAIDTSSANFTYDKVLSGNLGLTKIGDNMLTLTGVNTYAGETLLLGGTLDAAKAASLPGYDSPGKIQVVPQTANTTLAVRVGGAGQWTEAQINTLRSNATFYPGAFLGMDANDGDFTYTGNLSGNLGLTKLGSRTLTLTGTNTFTGDVNFNDGYLSVSALNKLGTNNKLNFDGGGLLFAAAFDPSVRTMTFKAGGAVLDTSLVDTVTLSKSIGNGGDGGFAKQGTGTLVLSASPNYKGLTIIDGGILKLGTAGSGVKLPSTTGLILTGSNAKLETSGNSQTIAYLAGFAGSEVRLGGGTLTTGDNESTTTYSGSITGSGGSLTKVGSGTFALDGVNTYTGNTLVSGGMLEVGKPTSLPGLDVPNTVKVTVNADAALTVWAGAATEWLSADIDKLLSKADFKTGSFLGVDTTSADFNYDSAIGGNLGLKKLGDNFLTLTGVNTYAGKTLVVSTSFLGGGLEVEKAASLPSYDDPGMVTIDSSWLIVKAGTSGEWTSAEIGDLQSNAVFKNGSVLAIKTDNADFTYSGVLGGSLGFAKAGVRKLTFTGTNTYTGGTQVIVGTLVAGKPASLPGYDVQNKVVVENNATLAVRAGAVNEWLPAQIDTLISKANFKSTINETTFVTSYLGIETDSANFAYASNIAGNMGLVKFGTSMLTLTGHNTYKGDTIIDEGSLLTYNTYSLPGYNGGLNPGRVGVSEKGTLILFTGPDSDQWTSSNISTLIVNSLFAPGSTIEINTDGDVTLSDGYGGSFGLTKSGSERLTLAGQNIYSGPTKVKAGMLMADTNVSLPDYNTSGKVSVSNNATLMLWAGPDSGQLQWSETEIAPLLSHATFETGSFLGLWSATNELKFAGAFNGNFGLLKRGTGVVEFDAAVSYPGATIISDIIDHGIGTLKFKNNLTTTLHDISGNGNLIVDGASTVLSANSIKLNTVTVGAGSKIVIAPMSSTFLPLLDVNSISTLPGYSSAVPEPSTLLSLCIAAAAILFAARRKK